ncbi:MAG: hypothetical protein FJ044_01305 [Candidatus Cloacimonetes bacterium]|nr:hypothetical protein [Candidatus Cloacimonadota bacterium]
MSNYLLFATKNGLVKKTPLGEYENIRSSGLIAVKLDEGDSLLSVKETSGNDKVILVTAGGKAIRFTEKDIRPTGRATRGVRGIKLGKDDEVVGMDTIENSKPKTQNSKLNLLVVTENGYGKMTPVEEYSQQVRGGKGVFTAKVTEKTGKIVDMRLVELMSKETEELKNQRTKEQNQKTRQPENQLTDLLIISAQGQVIRLPLSSVPTLGRQTQGVHLINLSPGDTVAALALLENG